MSRYAHIADEEQDGWAAHSMRPLMNADHEDDEDDAAERNARGTAADSNGRSSFARGQQRRSAPSSSSSLAFLTDRLPPPLRRIVHWVEGPPNPRPFKIMPVYGPLQLAPLRQLQRYCPSSMLKMAVFALACLLWLGPFSYFAARNMVSSPIPGYGLPLRLSCVSRPWPNDGRDCGLNGQNCLPFDGTSFVFRCPAECEDAKVWEPYKVGALTAVYQSLVIGGPGGDAGEAYYRGDSFICPAAIHAGVVSNRKGGCGLLTMVGEKHSYAASDRHGISTIGFNSSFPMSYTISPLNGENAKCSDIRWNVLLISVVFTIAVSVLTTSPDLFFYSIFAVVFFQVGLVSDAPEAEKYMDLVQGAVAKFLPALFTISIFYIYFLRDSLRDIDAMVEKTVLWVGGCWIGGLENYTLDKMPLRRLTPKDLAEQPGAIVALLILIAIIIAIAIPQIWILRTEGKLPRFLRLYGYLTIFISFLVLLPGLHLRLHHYVLGLLFLPATGVQTRPSLFLQGLLVGLFINGVARWGFASILETDASLAGNDGPLGTLLPDVAIPAIQGATIRFTWKEIAQGWNGVSVRINDVERVRWFKDHGPRELKWERSRKEPLYFRFAYIKGGFMDGFKKGDYSEPGTWEADGLWLPGKPK